MLLSLEIKNFAIIDKIQLEFSPRLNIITGETGAGKSIILGALGLLKGERAQANQMLHPDEKGFIEGRFNIEKLELKNYFEYNDLDYAPEILIRRELLPGGKSRAFINDTPCSIQLLQELGEKLVNIHSQHDSLELKSHQFQLQIVDAYADIKPLKMDFKSQFNDLSALKSEYARLIDLKSKGDKELELKKYHFEELNQYDINAWDWSKMETDLEWMENAMEVKLLLQASSNALSYDEMNLVDALTDILNKVRKYDKTSSELQKINETLANTIEELKQTSKDYESMNNKIEYDEEQILELQSKIQFGVNIMRKHQVNEFHSLLNIKEQLALDLSKIENLDTEINSLMSKIASIEKSCLQLAHHISTKRKAVLPEIEKTLLNYLVEMKMEESQFKIQMTTDEQQMTEIGIDSVRFLFSANKGKEPQDIKNAISGGEMSRFMLALKSMMAKKIQLPTLIFDEIDTGVSGIVASKVAMILEKLTEQHQVIAITHLPQIASRGDYHLMVYKETNETNTLSKIKRLDSEARELEIAKMISGENITETSLAGARELLLK